MKAFSAWISSSDLSIWRASLMTIHMYVTQWQIWFQRFTCEGFCECDDIAQHLLHCICNDGCSDPSVASCRAIASLKLESSQGKILNVFQESRRSYDAAVPIRLCYVMKSKEIWRAFGVRSFQLLRWTSTKADKAEPINRCEKFILHICIMSLEVRDNVLTSSASSISGGRLSSKNLLENFFENPSAQIGRNCSQFHIWIWHFWWEWAG